MKYSKKINTSLKIGLAIFLALFIGILVYTFSLYKDSKETQKSLIAEKEQIMSDFDKLTKRYDIAIAKNESHETELIAARGRIEDLKESLKTSKSSINSLMNYKKKWIVLQEEMEILLKENTELKAENTLLTNTLDSTQVQLTERTVFTDSLLSQNAKLASVLNDASALQAVGLLGMGVIERSNGKLIPTERARRSNKIKVCFTVTKNTLTDAGDKALYIQIIDPKNNVLGDNAQIRFDDNQVLNYSTVSRFNYENKSLNICEYIEGSENSKFEKGPYKVHVFNAKELITSSKFILR